MPRCDGFRLLLASTSARRRALLAEAGIAFETIDPGVDDGQLVDDRDHPVAWVMALAYLKARSAWERLADRAGAIVLGSDTIVVNDGRLIGQPRDKADARRIVGRLNDGGHRVVTGVALLDGDGRRLLTHDAADVRVGDVPESVREAYIATGSWRGKAGAYNFSERVADGWPIACEGDPTTVMGLPMLRLPHILDSFASGAARAHGEAAL